MKKWYVIQTLSGHEERVKQHIQKRLHNLGMEDMISEIFIPVEHVIEFRQGKKMEVARKLFPGYILIEAEMTGNMWQLIRQTPGVFGILGQPNKPTALNEQDVEEIVAQVKGKKTARPKEVFEPNETIRVIDGPFKDFIGTVGEVDLKHNKVKVMMNILGRVTPVELELYQIQRL